WPEILLKIIEKAADQIQISVPGVVVSYDSATNTAEIAPASWPVDVEPVPTTDCSVLWWAAGGANIQGVLAAGDEGMLIFSHLDDSGFCARGEASPENVHGVKGVKFMPCRVSDVTVLPNPPAAAGGLNMTATTVGVYSDDIKLGGTAEQLLAR